MATSGNKSVTVTSWDTLKFSWSLSSQSVANNTSTIKWTLSLIAGSSGRISSTASKDWSVTVNGTKYSGTNTVGISANSTKTLASGTTTIKHDTDGKKTFDYSFSQEFAITFSGSTIGTKSGSGSGTLTTIPRASSLTASNGTLGTAQTLKITENDSSFKHKITYTCGSVSGYAAGSSSGFTTSLSISWKPPTSLAAQSSGASVSITLYLKTYTSGGTHIGTTTKTISCSIPKSTLTVENGTLGTAQTLTVTKGASALTHTIKYTCGSTSGTICTKSTSTSISFTPPISLAKQNTTGTSVTVKYTITSYNDSTSIGSNSYSKTCSIPASVKPSCSLSVLDASGHYSTYGAYIKGQSKFKIAVTPTLAENSPIKSYSTTANGVTYTSASFTTGVLTSSGTLSISATVKDARGRSGTASKTATVLDYSTPQITLLKVKRCVSLTDGTEDIGGEFCQVTFSGKVSSLNNKNSAKYKLEYKKTSEDDSKYIPVNFDDLNKVYIVTNQTYIFPADSGSSYDVRVTVTDDITHHTQPTALSTGEVMEHWRADGKGMGFGKIGEVKNGADFGWKIKANEGFINILLPPETDLNNITVPNIYYGENVSTYNYINCPVTSGTFDIEVRSAGDDGQLHQILTVCSKTNPIKYERFYYTSAWGEWLLVPTFAQMTRIFGSAYELGVTLTKGENYSSVEATAYLVGNLLRCGMSATRSSEVNGNITNEKVATFKINHGGKIKSLMNMAFNNSGEGPVASFYTKNANSSDTECTFDVYLTATSGNLNATSTIFTMPALINLEAY